MATVVAMLYMLYRGSSVRNRFGKISLPGKTEGLKIKGLSCEYGLLF